MRLAIVSLTLVVAMAATAPARDIFVNNVAGNDRSAGQSSEPTGDPNGPLLTIGRALRMAVSCDRIVLANTGVPYAESISLVGSRNSGWQEQLFVLLGNGAILDGTAPVPADAWEYAQGNVFCFRPRELGHQQLFLEGRPATLVLSTETADLAKLQPLQWTMLGGAIYFCTEPGKRPESYALSYAEKSTGITLYHVEHVAIIDLTVQGFRLDGIQAANSARQVWLTSVTARGNGRCGVTVGGASQVTLQACTVGDNRFAQLLTRPYSETHVYDSDLPRLTAPAWIDQGGRFYLEKQRIEGGREEILGEPVAPKTEG